MFEAQFPGRRLSWPLIITPADTSTTAPRHDGDVVDQNWCRCRVISPPAAGPGRDCGRGTMTSRHVSFRRFLRAV